LFLDNGTLNINDPAGFTADLRGNVNESGNLSAAQTLLLNATSSENAVLNVPNPFTNAGTITATSISGGNYVLLQVAGNGLFTNALGATLTYNAGTGGVRLLRGGVVNNGTVTFNTSTSYDANGTVYTNNATT